MHVHNTWLLRHKNVDIVIPELFFETQDHVFLFCGTFQIRGICEDFEITDLDFVNLLFAATYLMVTDELLVGLLQKCRITDYKENMNQVHMLYMMYRLEVSYPTTEMATKFV